MPLTPSITLGQNPLTPNIVVATDNSSGSDAAITQRRIYIQDANGNYLVPSGTVTQYTQWDYADVAISLDILTQDAAVSSTTQWLDVTNVVLYTFTEQFCLPQYGKQFLYYLVQLNGIVPSTPMDTNYDLDTAILWSLIRGAINAVEDYDDIAGAQNCLERATNMELKQALYF